MAFCPNCGKPVNDGQRFCAVCGAPQPAAEVGGPAVSPGPGSDFEHHRDVYENKAFAVISYMAFLSLVSYFAAPKTSRFARFHAVQGLNLFILECMVSAAGGILRGMFFWAWPIGGIVSGIVGLAGVAFIVFSVIGIINASRGTTEELPFVSSFKIVK